jgi:hypothetical protein
MAGRELESMSLPFGLLVHDMRCDPAFLSVSFIYNSSNTVLVSGRPAEPSQGVNEFTQQMKVLSRTKFLCGHPCSYRHRICDAGNQCKMNLPGPCRP